MTNDLVLGKWESTEQLFEHWLRMNDGERAKLLLGALVRLEKRVKLIEDYVEIIVEETKQEEQNKGSKGSMRRA